MFPQNFSTRAWLSWQSTRTLCLTFFSTTNLNKNFPTLIVQRVQCGFEPCRAALVLSLYKQTQAAVAKTTPTSLVKPLHTAAHRPCTQHGSSASCHVQQFWTAALRVWGDSLSSAHCLRCSSDHVTAMEGGSKRKEQVLLSVEDDSGFRKAGGEATVSLIEKQTHKEMLKQ